MFTIEITKILPLFPNRAYVEFAVAGIETLSVPIPTLSFYVLRSEGEHPLDESILLNPLGTTGFYYIDTTPRLLSFYSQVNYQVYTTYLGTKYFSPLTKVTRHLTRDEFLRKRKMLYDEEIVLRKFSGVKIAIVKRRHIGDRCDICFDPNTKNVTRSHCKVCYGTGFKEPYYTPFVTYSSSLPPIREVDQIGQDHGLEVNYNKYQILDYPTVNPMDIMVDLAYNERYKIDRIEQTEIRRERVHQELTVTMLARTCVEYHWDIGNNLLEIPPSISTRIEL